MAIDEPLRQRSPRILGRVVAHAVIVPHDTGPRLPRLGLSPRALADSGAQLNVKNGAARHTPSATESALWITPAIGGLTRPNVVCGVIGLRWCRWPAVTGSVAATRVDGSLDQSMRSWSSVRAIGHAPREVLEMTVQVLRRVGS